jgi:hypothetical protein
MSGVSKERGSTSERGCQGQPGRNASKMRPRAHWVARADHMRHCWALCIDRRLARGRRSSQGLMAPAAWRRFPPKTHGSCAVPPGLNLALIDRFSSFTAP